MPTSNELIQAAADPDLRARFTALLAARGDTNAPATVEMRLGQLVAAVVGNEGQTVADVLAYARSQYRPMARPGEDLTIVTDDHLVQALTEVLGPPGD